MKTIKMKETGASESGDVNASTQYAALCYRIRKKKVQILMITSRRTKRWIIPKGWPIDGLSAPDGAAQEAWEEAGVIGKVRPASIGMYAYTKVGEKKGEVDLPCAALVYPLRVKTIKRKFPEHKQRRRKWMSRKKAANAVWEPELAALIRSFDP